MTAYEFYWFNPLKGYELLGVLPERRKNPERITEKSVMGWVERVYGKKLVNKDFYFIQVTINEYTGKIFRSTPDFLVNPSTPRPEGPGLLRVDPEPRFFTPP